MLSPSLEPHPSTFAGLVPASAPKGGAAQGIISTYVADLDEGLILIDRDGRIAFLNPRAALLLGLSAKGARYGLFARNLVRHAHVGVSESRFAILDRLRAPLRARRPVSFALQIDGEPISFALRPLPDAGWAVTIREAARSALGDQGPDGWRDPLTGLANRTLFGIRLKDALARFQRTGERFAVMAVDLDRFKHINDTLGHPVGDELLRKVAERLQTTLRATDVVARLGGDEFAVLQANVEDVAGAERLARRVVDLLGRSYMIDGHLINVGASVGVALAPDDGVVADVLVKHADLALYGAKLGGRNAFRFYEAEMSARMDARRLLELDLRKALAMREFELVYQPQLNLETDRLVGCEALIRWRHPVRGLVSPVDFIPLAEEIGLIVPIGEWVLRTACKEAVRWPGDLSVAVNLSPTQFKSKKLVDKVRSALTESGLAPHRLELEITEGVLLQDNDANLETLHALRGLGLRISMDDFGTGYSSLSYLRSFPFDKIKIDRSFVSGGATIKDSMAIVRAIASLGASFGMTTVAEGVETIDQMRRIRTEGCTDVQGYLISRPVSAADILKVLHGRNTGESVGNTFGMK